MRQFILGLACLCYLFLLSASIPCAADEKKDAPEKTLPEYYPLQVGNQWSYKVKVVGIDTTMVTRIAKIETIKDQPYARLEAELNGKVVATENLRKTKKGIIRLRTNDIEAEPPFLLLKLPAKPGDKWEGTFTAKGEKCKFHSEIFAEETIAVPAGKFKALRVSILLYQRKMIINSTYWFARGIGFVKQTVDTPGEKASDGFNITLELEKYKIVQQKKGK
jgi:hypothetical protein